MAVRALKLDRIRKEKNYTWIALSNATGIPSRTLQDIQTREAKKDMIQIGSGVKRRLLKVAEVWGMEYKDLFEDAGENGREYSENENPEGLYQSMKDFIAYREDVTEEAKKTYANLLQERFLQGSAETGLIHFLIADEIEINGLQEKTIEQFVSQCKQLDKPQIMEQMVIKLTDKRFAYQKAILLYFAIALAENDCADASEELFQAVNTKHEEEQEDRHVSI
jgi:transcriptional regulator with XRE-family HTH domain